MACHGVEEAAGAGEVVPVGSSGFSVSFSEGSSVDFEGSSGDSWAGVVSSVSFGEEEGEEISLGSFKDPGLGDVEVEAEGDKKRKRPSKKDLERFKQQKKQKKIAKTAWLRT